MAKKKLTKNQQEFKKQQRRLQKGLSRAKRQGWTMEGITIPDMPSRVTAKALREISQTKPKDLYKESVFVTKEGNRFGGEKALDYLRWRANEKRQRTRELNKRKNVRDDYYDYDYADEPINYNDFNETVIQNMRSTFLNYPPEIAGYMVSYIDNLVATMGEQAVAQMFITADRQLYEFLNRSGYDSKQSMQEYATHMIDYLPDIDDDTSQMLKESFESHFW